MTMQRSDTIIINDIEYSLGGIPLEQYWDAGNQKPPLGSLNTSMRMRSYYATWLIEDKKLYLIGFYGENFFSRKEFSIEDLFPGSNGKVFAEWFSGKLSIRYGNEVGPFLVDFINYEHYTTFEIQKGILMHEIVIEKPSSH